MRELTQDQIENVAGAGGAPATVANATGVGIIIGSLGAIGAGIAAGTPVGPAGMIIGGILGGLGVAVGSATGSSGAGGGS
ncbi:hypothetical protein [Raoultella ornithinolytica]|uniref:hypothetical protein n=1 Tax=Raoultella ornithinolytica TaxID=54291 RepID=UPI0009039783|nr:hypothetical protein [Raoultella ornithinolytica]ATM23234.1 microcin H47 [Raoultella ornithinolytica]EKU8635284.1 microcin H47 [Raoultella ornithinolytica]EKX4891534.1 microcin H47 [Raoultella ornithinolytica]ELH1434179.1 microcin H47 [Raoultella ornithinolytica]ELS0898050.1 microcin H47 [Raoultella ornithinolytica]